MQYKNIKVVSQSLDINTKIINQVLPYLEKKNLVHDPMWAKSNKNILIISSFRLLENNKQINGVEELLIIYNNNNSIKSTYVAVYFFKSTKFPGPNLLLSKLGFNYDLKENW